MLFDDAIAPVPGGAEPAPSPAPSTSEPPVENDDEIPDGQTEKVDAGAKEVQVPMSRKQRDAVERKALLAKISEAADQSAKATAALAEERDARVRIEATLEEMKRGQAARPAPPPPAADADADGDDIDAETQVKLAAMEKVMWEKVRAGQPDALTTFQRQSATIIAKALAAKAAAAAPKPEPSFPPEVAALRAQHYNVLADPIGEAALRYQDALLGKAGMKPSFERTKKAFEEASKSLGYTKAPAPTRAQEAALGGAGKAAGGAGRGGSPSVKLPDGMTMRDVREVSKAAGISPERYLARYAQLHPEDMSDE